MRFLMNSPVVLTSTAVDPCVPTKLSLDALGLSYALVSSAQAWLPSSGLLARTKRTTLSFYALVQSCFSKLLLTARASPRRHLHPSSKVLFPYLSHLSRRLRPTFE